MKFLRCCDTSCSDPVLSWHRYDKLGLQLSYSKPGWEIENTAIICEISIVWTGIRVKELIVLIDMQTTGPQVKTYIMSNIHQSHLNIGPYI